MSPLQTVMKWKQGKVTMAFQMKVRHLPQRIPRHSDGVESDGACKLFELAGW